MNNGKFILCRNCRAVHHVTALDKAPRWVSEAGESHELPADDWRAFMNQHAGHHLESLKALGERYFPGGSMADPMAVGYFEVTNGRQKFLLRRYRRSVDEPLRFEFMQGRLGGPVIDIEIQEREIRKELKLRFRWGPNKALSDANIDLFVDLFRDAVGALDASSVAAAEPSDTDDNVSYVPLESSVKESLLRKCARRFPSAEVEALGRFVEAHSEGSDVMTLVLRRRFAIGQQG